MANEPKVDIRILIHDKSDPENDTSDIYTIKGSGYDVLSTLSAVVFDIFMKAEADIEDAKRITCDNFDRWYNIYKESKESKD